MWLSGGKKGFSMILMCAPFNAIWKEVANSITESTGEKISAWIGPGASSSGLKMRAESYDAITMNGPAYDEVCLSPTVNVADISSESLYSALKIYDRCDQGGKLSTSERMYLFQRQVSFAKGLLEEQNVTQIVFSNIPHLPYDYALYLAAQLGSIPVVMANTTPIHGYYYITRKIGGSPLTVSGITSPVEYSSLIEPFLFSNKNNLWYMGRQNSSKGFISSIRAGGSLRLGARSAAVFVKRRLVGGSPKKLASIKRKQGVFSGDSLSMLERLKVTRQQSRGLNTIRREYNKHASLFLPENYIFFPLHYQPEATTAPLAGFWSDQLSLIERIASSLSDNTRLIVKEHSTTFHPDFYGGSGRFPGYYEYIAQIPGVTMISLDHSTKELVKNSKAVIALTGTAGWEAVVNGVPCISVAPSWYSECEGVLRWRPELGESFPDLSDTMASSNLKGFWRQISKYLIAADIHGVAPHIDSEAGAKSISRAIVSALSGQ